MQFSEITSFDDPRVEIIYTAYTSTFPENERRSYEQFSQLFNNPNVNVCSIVHENKCIGYIIIWKLNNFTFLEHFEVFSEFRNFKYGSSIIQLLIQHYPKLVLEAEPSTLDEMASRRIAFYERNGFTIVDQDYIQPSYGEGKSPIPLYLLSTWKTENITSIISEIKNVVYNF